MNLLLNTLLLTCQNPQVDLEVHVYTSSAEVVTLWDGWGEGMPKLTSGSLEKEWWAIDFSNVIAPTSDWNLALADGSWLPGHPVIGVENPSWQLAGLSQVAPMPLDTLWLQALGRKRLPQADAEKDQLWVRTSSNTLDRLFGYLIEWSPAGIVFETSVKERLVTWSQVDALAVLAEDLPQQSNAVWIHLVNGGVLTARIVSADTQVLQLELPWGTAWSLPLEAIARIRKRQGLEEWSSKSWDYVQQPASEIIDWTPRVNQSIEGRRLCLWNSVYAQGIGVHVNTVLARQAPSAGTFMVTVGVDQSVASFREPQAVRFQILFEDRVLADSGAMHVQDQPRSLMVSVPGPGRLQLVAEAADVLPFGGHANWCDMLWKSAQPAD